jgi:hypothetical protein
VALARTTESPFEGTFARYAGAIPQAYLRSLAYRESAFRPDVVHPRSKATGLFQITTPALVTFNQRQKSALQLAHLVDPDLNTRVAVHHLGDVINAYRKLRSLQPGWTSRRWIELVTLGWNAGHNAVARIVASMEASNVPPERITADSVSQVARGTGTAKYVADPARVTWARSVADLFLGGGAVPAGGRTLVAQADVAGGGGPIVLVLVALAGVLGVAVSGKQGPREEAP